LAKVLQLLLARCQAEMLQTEQESLVEGEEPPPQPPRALPHPGTWRPHPPQQMERAHQAGQAEREVRFRQITSLRSQGMKLAEIAKRVGMSERSVRTWLKEGTAPLHRRRRKRRSVFDPYAAYVLQRWKEGKHS
jgi:DNA-directed RNA polymerase specialized sigma24 family protein